VCVICAVRKDADVVLSSALLCMLPSWQSSYVVNWFVCVDIRKYCAHTRYVILTYSATILTRWKAPDDGHIRIQPKHIVKKKDDYIDNKLHLRRKYMCANDILKQKEA
jgi:hypothetical protein